MRIEVYMQDLRNRGTFQEGLFDGKRIGWETYLDIFLVDGRPEHVLLCAQLVKDKFTFP